MPPPSTLALHWARPSARASSRPARWRCWPAARRWRCCHGCTRRPRATNADCDAATLPARRLDARAELRHAEIYLAQACAPVHRSQFMTDSPAYPTATSIDDFRRNLARVCEHIAAACLRAGRDPAEVRLLPVSKTVDEARIRLAYAAGCRELGENKVQEAHAKWEAMADLPDLRWAVIGHLQTSKAKLVARFASEFQALDSLRVAEALDRR